MNIIESIFSSPYFTKLVRTISYYLAPLFVLLLVFMFPDYKLFLNLGNAAMLLVTANLFLKPIVVLFPFKILKKFMHYRREVGVLSFWMFVGHALGMFVSQAYTIQDVLDFNLFIILGMIAGYGMIILALTSNNLAVKYLKRNWKKVQQLAYPTFFIIVAHAALAEGEIGKVFLFGGSFIVLKGLQYWKQKKRIGSAQD
ncbi:MAG: hypothetical protein GW941_02475 [Candidatus Pacebacteria bacterium]|nr:hypothetical protein [Candidatus Paceibacterota bacterium]